MYKYLLYFLIFSFLGWCAEVIFHLLKEGAFVNRGLAKGPICPIYGVGICLIDLLLGSIDSFLLLALLSMAVATAVELLAGYFTDHFLSLRLWDYSSEQGNILGYVCPRFSLIWGVVCALVIKLLPSLDGLIARMESPLFYALSFLLLIFALSDVKLSMLKPDKRVTKRIDA